MSFSPYSPPNSHSSIRENLHTTEKTEEDVIAQRRPLYRWCRLVNIDYVGDDVDLLVSWILVEIMHLYLNERIEKHKQN